MGVEGERGGGVGPLWGWALSFWKVAVQGKGKWVFVYS